MLRMRHIGIYFRTALMAGSLLFCACNKDELISGNENTLPKSEYISFGIKMSGEWTPDSNTKGMQKTRSEALPMESAEGNAPETEIQIYMIEEDLPDVLHTQTPGTKADDEEDKNIGIIAYQLPNTQGSTAGDFNLLASGAEVFMENIYLPTYGAAEGNSYKYWPGAGSWLKFFAYRPYCTTPSDVLKGEDDATEGLALTNIDDIQPQFEYKVPGDVGEHIDLMAGTTIEIEGSKDVMILGDKLGAVSIALNHILSQIQVKAGVFEFGEGYIKSVSFENIYNYGTKSMISGDWITGKNKAVFKQDFTEDGTGNGIDLSSLEGDDKNIGSPYYFIPQELPEDATITIVLAVKSPTNGGTDNEYTLSKKLREFTENWKPDKKYTYVISTPEEVEVEVSDEVSDDKSKKTDLKIRNTGLSPAYIRAAIVGSWVIDDGDGIASDNDKIVADWEPDKAEQGTFVWGSDNSGSEPGASAAQGWVKHDDGYYYHLNLVPRGEETAVLFESFTIGNAPVPDAQLDLTILVQAIYPDDLTHSGWPQEIIDKYTSVAFIRE